MDNDDYRRQITLEALDYYRDHLIKRSRGVSHFKVPNVTRSLYQEKLDLVAQVMETIESIPEDDDTDE